MFTCAFGHNSLTPDLVEKCKIYQILKEIPLMTKLLIGKGVSDGAKWTKLGVYMWDSARQKPMATPRLEVHW